MKIEEVEELMKSQGWTRTQLAANAGVSEGTVHRWFRDEAVPPGAPSMLLSMLLTAARGVKKKSGKPVKGGKR